MTTPRRHRRPPGSEQGAAALELAVWLPVLLFLVLASVSATSLLIHYGSSTRLSTQVARYATRHGLDPDNPSTGYRPSAAEVDAYGRAVADVEVVSISVTPDPSSAFPGTDITVAVTTRQDLGPLADAANAVVGLLGQDDVFPDGAIDIAHTVTMREE